MSEERECPGDKEEGEAEVGEDVAEMWPVRGTDDGDASEREGQAYLNALGFAFPPHP